MLVNGLLDCAGGPAECAREAQALAAQGYAALKIKARCLTWQPLTHALYHLLWCSCVALAGSFLVSMMI